MQEANRVSPREFENEQFENESEATQIDATTPELDPVVNAVAEPLAEAALPPPTPATPKTSSAVSGIPAANEATANTPGSTSGNTSTESSFHTPAEIDAQIVAAAPLVRGNVEGLVRDCLGGWVSIENPHTGQLPDGAALDGVAQNGIALTVHDGNQLVLSGIADIQRADLNEAGLENAFGFELALPVQMFDGRARTLLVRHANSETIIGSHELAAASYARTMNNRIEAGMLCGAIQLIENSAVNNLVIVVHVDGVILLEATCSKTTSDRDYHYRVSLPIHLYDDMAHEFSVTLKHFPTNSEPLYERLSSIQTPWEYIRSSTCSRFSALSKISAYRYDSLQQQVDRAISDGNTDEASPNSLGNIKTAHGVLVEGYEGRKKFPKLVLPVADKPLVSLVIPVHNKFSLSYNCIASLILAYNKTSFEVIIVDDQSSDETVDIQDYVDNVRYIRNDRNLGFLLSSQAGADQAKGDYIVFLNNDTEATSGWLDGLCDTFDRFDHVGMVGSKLIYPNGKLQEAGGIVWGSGKPWNIGNGQNAEAPQFNYTRQADYLSGASMMVRRDVWEQIGGFSKEFAPAYYEDTDLAFKVREAGYKTFYCPQSVIIHFEGMSNGRDVNAGIKRFQSVNAPKFRAKWRHAYRHNGQEGQMLSREMDRNVDFRAIVVDYSTPRPDQDAGGYATSTEIALLQELGCKVTFIPNNMAHLGSYTEALQASGVECIYAPFYNSVGDFLRERGREYDLVYVTRYDIAEQIIPSIREFTNARIVFNNCDLHFLRELRAAFASGASSLDEPLETRERELRVMRDADVVLSYNDVEHSVIASHNLVENNIFKCPWVLESRRSTTSFENRQGIAFLGGFNHHPNREAVKYFVDTVMPLIRHSNPEIKLHVYGSNITPDITELAADDVIIEGYVESLSDVFDSCRVFVAPLLSGAGIKGKVLESIAHGIPCVLSPVAAESTGLVNNHSAFIANSESEWNDMIGELYKNPTTWQSMSDNSHDLINSLYSIELGLQQMEAVLQFVELDPAEDRPGLFASDRS